MKPKVDSSGYVHENPWYKVRHDRLTWPNGKVGQYFVAEFPGAACIICIRDGCLLTVEQYRYPIDRMSVEIPMGGLRPDEAPLAAAQRELREETGYEAVTWESLGQHDSMNGAIQMKVHTFVAEGLSECAQDLDESEHGLRVHWILLDEWRAMIRRGDVTDGDTLAAWMVYTAKYLA